MVSSDAAIDMIRSIKILVSAGLMGYLLYALNWGSAIGALRHAEPVALLIAILNMYMQILISA